MEMRSLKCPDCGANLEVEKDRDRFYCSHCGHNIVMSELSAPDAWAKVNVRKYERDEHVNDSNNQTLIELEREKRKTKNQEMVHRLITIVACLAMLAAMTKFFHFW